jgi:hypothetical protein
MLYAALKLRRYGLLALLILGLLIEPTNSAVAQESKSSYPTIKNRKIAASELERILRKEKGAELQDVQVIGLLYLPNVKLFSAYHVKFSGGLFASTPDAPRPGIESSHILSKDVKRGLIEIRYSLIEGPVDFYHAQVSELILVACEFKGTVSLHSVKTTKLTANGSTFHDRVTFVNSRIAEHIALVDVSFLSYSNFSGAVVGGHADLLRVYSSVPIQIEWALLGDKWLSIWEGWATDPTLDSAEAKSRQRQIETELRFWKRNFDALGQKRDALEVNRDLILFHRRHFLDRSQLDWWLSYFLDWPNNYGTQPYRPVLVGVLVIVFFIGVYFLLRVFEPTSTAPSGHSMANSTRIGYSVIYSLNAFIPLVKLVDEDKWGWRISKRYRWLELSESALGLIISLLAAYSVTSYVL